jgi:chromatin segregation and condensation protein Rec8/ScpA/Scc1 (kleisin family)
LEESTYSETRFSTKRKRERKNEGSLADLVSAYKKILNEAYL